MLAKNITYTQFVAANVRLVGSTSHYVETIINRASDILRGCGPAKFRFFCKISRNFPPPQKREIPRDPPEIFPNTCQQNKSYLILILAIRPVLFTPNVQIYLETSSLQRVNNIPKLPGVF